MICPVGLTSDMSALQAVRVGDHAGHDLLHAGRDGAGDESTGSDFASDGQEDHVVAGGRDYWHYRPSDATLAGALRAVRGARSVRSAAGQTLAQTGGGSDRGTGAAVVPREVLRPQRTPLS